MRRTKDPSMSPSGGPPVTGKLTATSGAKSYSEPIPQVTLHSLRFVTVITLGLAITAVILGGSAMGFVVEREVTDPIGSTHHADSRVEHYQTLNGFVLAAVGLLLEEYYRLFFVVIATYLANRRWFPGDRPSEGNGPIKRAVLIWSVPMMLYLLNIGISSIFIEHRFVRVERGFDDRDLTAVAASAATIRNDDIGRHKGNSILDTVLRNAARGHVEPFQIDPTSQCSANNQRDVSDEDEEDAALAATTARIPRVTKLKSTSVSYGFTPRAWNYAALPRAVKPTDVIELGYGKRANESDAQRAQRYAAFQARTGLTDTTFEDMIVQGFTLFDKAVTESNAYAGHLCPIVDHDVLREGETAVVISSEKVNRRSLTTRDPVHAAVDENDDEDFDDDAQVSDVPDMSETEMEMDDVPPMCAGAGTTLWALSRMTEWTPDGLIRTMTAENNSESTPMANTRPGDARVRIETIQLSPAINLTAITLDIPYADFIRYRVLDASICTAEGKFGDMAKMRKIYNSTDEFEKAQREQCDPTYIAYDDPETQCGATGCVFRDESQVLGIKKQFLLTNFATGCSAQKITYNYDLHTWYPTNCQVIRNSTFIYGLGSYVTGVLEPREGTGPVLKNVRRHRVLTFIKLEWRFEDLRVRFDAQCDARGGCDGLLFPLQRSTGATRAKRRAKRRARVLVVGQKFLPEAIVNQTWSLKSPLQLVSVNAPKVIFTEGDMGFEQGIPYYEWEHLDTRWLTPGTNGGPVGFGITKGTCSVQIDAYLNQIANNHYFIKEPLQAMYSSALFYLFQNAKVKVVDLPAGDTSGVVSLSNKIIGKSRMGGDLEKKQIRYSITNVSAVSTLIGVACLIFHLIIVLMRPCDSVKISDETNFPTQYANVLMDDVYPSRVCRRELRFPTGELIRMDDYDVGKITFSHAEYPGERITLGADEKIRPVVL